MAKSRGHTQLFPIWLPLNQPLFALLPFPQITIIMLRNVLTRRLVTPVQRLRLFHQSAALSTPSYYSNAQAGDKHTKAKPFDKVSKRQGCPLSSIGHFPSLFAGKCGRSGSLILTPTFPPNPTWWPPVWFLSLSLFFRSSLPTVVRLPAV